MTNPALGLGLPVGLTSDMSISRTASPPGGPLPPLRQELALHAGPRLRDGQPSWTLHDPVRHQFFQLDWLSFEVLARWPLHGERSLLAIAEDIATQTALKPEPQDVAAVLQFLMDNELVHRPGADVSASLARRAAAQRTGGWRWLLHHYLFFRIPLLKPDAVLAALLRPLAVVFTPAFWGLSLLAAGLGIVLAARQWELFRRSFVDLLSFDGLMLYALTMTVVKCLHELGHGLVARRHGCRVPTMGVAFMVLWPMPYTDTQEAWKLPRRGPRLQIAAAGVATELLIAAWATLAWALLPDGGLRQAALLLATTTWISTVLVNCSPFMRFDGYFWLSDALEMPNLHARAFALARWRIRELLFDLRAEPPEYVTRARRRGLVMFAIAVWIYRLGLFFGIALLVYGFFVKAIGILLFIVEIAWFVIMPIAAEVRVWFTLWPVIRRRLRTAVSATLALGALSLLVVPLPGQVAASGLLQTGVSQVVYATSPARIERLPVADGAAVGAGAPLVELSADQAQQQLQAVHSRIRRYQAEADAAATQSDLNSRLPVAQAQLSTARAAQRNLAARLQERQPLAPFSGTVRWHSPDLRVGDWVAAHEPLMTVIAPGAWQVEAYLREDELHRITVGSEARFHPDGRFGDPILLVVSTIARDAAHTLPQSELSSSHGGSVETREIEGRHVPERAVYRVTFTAQTQPPELAGQQWRGRVRVDAAAESVLARFQRAALAVWWREAGW